LGGELWRVSNPRSRRYAGIGAFQLVSRSAYEAIGTHQRLAMEVLDDMKLGKLVKSGGFRSGVARAEEMIWVRLQEGLGNLVRGLTKNGFSACSFRLPLVMFTALMLFVAGILPFLALFLTNGTARALAAISVAAALIAHGWTARKMHASPLYALT